jgi:hypothetical protein
MNDLERSDDGRGEKGYEIVVNGELHIVGNEIVTYEEIVVLAFPTPPTAEARLTITFRDAKDPKEGSLKRGGRVEVKKQGTIFNATATTNS